MDLAEIVDRSLFEELRPEWDELLARRRGQSLCLSHEWLAAWWGAFDGREGRVCALTARENGRLVGALPLRRRRTTVAGVPLQSLEFAANLHAFRFDFLLDGEHEAAPLVEALLGRALEASPAPDVLFFKDLPRASDTIEALERTAEGRGFAFGLENERRSLLVPLDGSWEGYFGSRSASFRSFLRRYHRKCLAAGARFEPVPDGKGAGEILEKGLALEAAGWKGRGGTAILNQPEAAAFYRSLADRLRGTGRVKQYALWREDRLLAWDLCVVHEDVCYFLKTAYDEEEGALSPGSALRMLELQHLFEERRFSHYDLLPPAAEYKRRWSGDGIDQVSVRLYTRTPRGRLARLLQGRLRPWLRQFALLRQVRRRIDR